MSDHGFWAVQSLVTEPGPAAAAIDRLPSDLGALRAASQQLVFHYWADGDYAANGIAPERISEIDTRYAAAMFARLGELADLPLSAAREPRQRLVGCCRDFTVLFVAMARHKWIPSRARVGFARYFFDGWLIDHEIAEVWDGSAERWRLVEPEIDDGHTDPVDGASFDALDVPPDRFLTAPRAWQLARSGAVDPERFVVDPGLEIPATRGLPQLRRNLVRDLAALNKTEMLLWEDWGVLDSHAAPGPGELPVLDELATLTGQPSPPLGSCNDCSDSTSSHAGRHPATQRVRLTVKQVHRELVLHFAEPGGIGGTTTTGSSLPRSLGPWRSRAGDAWAAAAAGRPSASAVPAGPVPAAAGIRMSVMRSQAGRRMTGWPCYRRGGQARSR